MEIFGLTIGKSTGTRRVGAQPMPKPNERLISTALQNVSRQQSMNSQPDPTLGAPFSSFPNNRLTVAQMGPGEPAENFPLGGEPRQWKYRVGWNFPTTPDTDRGINGELLRALADSFWLLRRCIEIRKAEVCGLSWDIVARGRTGSERKHNAEVHAPLMDSIREFFLYPEGYYSFTTSDANWLEMSEGVAVHEAGDWKRRGLVDWGDWLNAVLEDYFVGDWVALWPQRTLGNEMLGMRRVDGQHIKALLDLDGRVPPPPMPAWQQYLYGVPRASWAADEFYYAPRNVRNMTPYGFSHVQQALILINEGLKFDMWNTAAYSENTIPMGLLESAPGFTADEIRDVADFLNGATAGDLGGRQRIYPVPNGTKWQPIKPFIFDEKFAMYVIETTCAAMDVQPQELGFAPSHSSLGGSGFAQEQSGIHKRKGLVPLARWMERKLTRIIQEQWRGLGGEMLEFRFTDILAEDAQARYAAQSVAILGGIESIDDIVEQAGGSAPGVGRILQTTQGTLFLDRGFVLTGQGVVKVDFKTGDVPEASLPAAQAAEAHNPQAQGPKDDGAPKRDEPSTAKAAQADPKDRRREEEAFLAAWAAFWARKLDAARSATVTATEMAEAALHLTRDEQLELSHILQDTLREPLYTAAMDALRQEAGLPHGPSVSATRNDVLRLQTGSQTHMAQVAETYHTDLDRAYQDLLEEWQSEPSREKRGALILAGLIAWAKKRVPWKGQQIASTEGTDAETQAQTDFQVQNPKILREWRWIAVMDEETCDVCAALDGQVIGPNGPFPGAHPGCRCHLEPAVTLALSTDDTSGPPRG